MKKIVLILLVFLSFSTLAEEGDSVCPVKLLNFKAEVKDNVALLQWSTSSELNNEKFEIERSTDGNSFSKIGEVQGNGNSDQIIIYMFKDITPLYKSAYYRIKQVDYNGDFEYFYSNKVSNTTEKVIIYPIPFTNSINITDDNPSAIINNDGKIVASGTGNINTEFIAPGLYTLAVDNKIYKIIKQ